MHNHVLDERCDIWEVVFVKYYVASMFTHTASKSGKTTFSMKAKVKVTRSLTLVSLEKASLVEYTYQIWSLYLQ